MSSEKEARPPVQDRDAQHDHKGENLGRGVHTKDASPGKPPTVDGERKTKAVSRPRRRKPFVL